MFCGAIEDLYLALEMELRKVNDDSMILWCLRLTPGEKNNSLLHRKAVVLVQILLLFCIAEVMTVPHPLE